MKNQIQRRILIALAALLLSVQVAEARFFIVPVVEVIDPVDGSIGREAAHVRDCLGTTTSFFYGFQPVAFVSYACPAANELFISQQAGVISFPANDQLDVPLTPLEISQWEGTLEHLNIPALGLLEGATGRSIARRVVGMCKYMSRLEAVQRQTFGAIGVAGLVFDESIPLNTRWVDLDPAIKINVIAAATSLGFSDDPIRDNPNQTLRNVLKRFADQFGNTGFAFVGFTL